MPGKHCAFCFTHEAAKGMDMNMAKKYAENILAIIHEGSTPPITEVHAGRVCTQGFPPLMPENLKQQVKAFDFHAVNKNLEGLFAKNPGAIRVERIATSMGCLITTCVAEVKHLPTLTNGIVSWAKPIMEANAIKGKICMEWRKTLEKQPLGRASADPASHMRMQVGAMFTFDGEEDAGNSSAHLIVASKLETPEGTAADALQNILSLDKD